MAATELLLTRHGLRLAAVIALVVVGAALLAGLALIENDFRPEGGLFGLPTRIQMHGAWFELDAADTSVLTMDQVDARRAAVEASVGWHQPLTVLEPTIGKVPLFAEVEAEDGLLVFLHVGPDQYVEYDARP